MICGGRGTWARRGVLGIATTLVLALGGASPAAADTPNRDLPDAPTLNTHTTGPRVSVHFRTTGPSGITLAQANQIGQRAVAALGFFEDELGMSGPRDDGDGRLDIYVYRFPEDPTKGFPGSSSRGAAKRDSSATRASAYVMLDVEDLDNVHTLPHEVFHVLQLGQYSSSKGLKSLFEGSATWAGARATGDAGGRTPLYRQRAGVSIFCTSSECPKKADPYKMWPLFEFAQRRYGSGFIQVLFRSLRLVDADSPAERYRRALRRAIDLRSDDTLAGFAVRYGLANARGDHPLPLLKGLRAILSENLGGVDEVGESRQATFSLRRYATKYVRLAGGCGGCRLRIRLLTQEGVPADAFMRGVRPVTSPAGGTPDVTWNEGSRVIPWPAGSDIRLSAGNGLRDGTPSVRFSVRVLPPA